MALSLDLIRKAFSAALNYAVAICFKWCDRFIQQLFACFSCQIVVIKYVHTFRKMSLVMGTVSIILAYAVFLASSQVLGHISEQIGRNEQALHSS